MTYQPYPTGGNRMMQPPPPPPPVQNAVKLMYAGAGISALGLILGVLTLGSLKSAIEKASPTLTASQVNAAEAVGIAFVLIFGLLGVGLWVWMARMNGAGRSWARIVASVLFGLNTIGLFSDIARPNSIITVIFAVLGWLVGLGAIVLLWRPESTAFYNAASGR
jgi:hypothetical protein